VSATTIPSIVEPEENVPPVRSILPSPVVVATIDASFASNPVATASTYALSTNDLSV